MKDESIMSLKVTNGEIIHHSALSVRDYFAAKAMQGILVNPAESYEYESVQRLLAKCAYQIADAMLNERAK